MVDGHALGACGLGRAGSNPASPPLRVRFGIFGAPVSQSGGTRSRRRLRVYGCATGCRYVSLFAAPSWFIIRENPSGI